MFKKVADVLICILVFSAILITSPLWIMPYLAYKANERDTRKNF